MLRQPLLGVCVVIGSTILAIGIYSRRAYFGATVQTSLAVSKEFPKGAVFSDWGGQKDELVRSLTISLKNQPCPLTAESASRLASTFSDVFEIYQSPRPDGYLDFKNRTGQPPRSTMVGETDTTKIWIDARRSVAKARWDLSKAEIHYPTAGGKPFAPRHPTAPGTAVFRSTANGASVASGLPIDVGRDIAEMIVPILLIADDGSEIPGKFIITLGWSPKLREWLIVNTALTDVPTGKSVQAPPA